MEELIISIEIDSEKFDDSIESIKQQLKHLTGLFKQQAQAIVVAFNPVIHKIQGVSGEVKKLANEIGSCIIQADTLAKLEMNDQQQSTDGSTIVQDVSSAVDCTTIC